MTFDDWASYTSAAYKPTDDSTRVREMRACWAAAAETTRQGIVEALGDTLLCPCCTEYEVCSDDCTFATDCPEDAERLELLRLAVRA